MAYAQPSTLPGWLRHQAQRRPHAIALRHKRLGAWRALSWHRVITAVKQLAAGLAQRGFTAGDALLLVSHPREETLLLSLAAQWNGGVAIPLDPQIVDEGLRVIDANPRNLTRPPHPAVTDHRALPPQPEGGFASATGPHDDAFAFVHLDANGQLVAQRSCHATLVREALQLVGRYCQLVSLRAT
ncbi:AMP-binding protein [Paraburkholderia aromaticivorans]|uniref:AMP-binding protein n=1 Tax=Paraburkholderia aromaticivorans TaxID=2026199 RepID=UPI0019805FC5|nr:AMP-binding protein [Paraburkholderia aromaticivorans]